MTNEMIREAAKQANDALAPDAAWDTLDQQAQSMLFDTASAIINFGGPTTPYELKVAELYPAILAAPPAPEGAAAKKGKSKLDADEAELKKDREEEKQRIAAWKGAITEEERKRREKEEDRLDKEEERIEKARLKEKEEEEDRKVKTVGKNGPEKK